MNLEFFLNYTFLKLPLLYLGLSLLFFLSVVWLRNFIASVLLKPFKLIARRSKGTWDDKVIHVLEGPLKVTLVFFSAYGASSWLPYPALQRFIDLSFKTFLTFLIFWILYRLVNRFSHLFMFVSSKFGTELDNGIQNFTIKALRVLIIALGLMAILQKWGINVSAFVASLGLGGLAFALAAKDTVANLFGSLVIFSDKPFQVGDWIEMSGVEGTIEEIGIRSTKIRNHAQALVSVPNAEMANTTITNWSRMGKRRIRMRIGLTYATSVEQMQTIVREIKAMLQNHPEVHPEVIVVNFDEFEASALSILLNFFTNTIVTAEYLHVKQDINFKIMEIVAHNGAQFAFPSQSLYVESLPK
ncbi:mechanosensitive ion channel family protein [Sulfurospirillum barnesii]|uniref:Small-conductance mechanosensitive channel n=1 Tax=Sulfurospirillum barnesii (strain ATCC 700032 / DSM 10660 / SES-3) TaxID=760154 RepID=I3XYU4_SULBS|nr:mechanosensitive ion channel family protein [Sulfurospirillum barnesii]AFL69118.1 small-conductance mechanosensitive channel [Sulfurospirillum barnesii SES-3]